MNYGYGDTPEQVQKRIDQHEVRTNTKWPVAVALNGGPLVFGFLRMEVEQHVDHFPGGNSRIRAGRYDWGLTVEALPLPGPVNIACGDVETQPLTGLATHQQSWTVEANQRMWTTYGGVSELHGYPEALSLLARGAVSA